MECCVRIVCPEPDRHASQCNVDVEEESPDDVWRSMVSWTTGSVRAALGAFISERWQLCQAHVPVFWGGTSGSSAQLVVTCPSGDTYGHSGHSVCCTTTTIAFWTRLEILALEVNRAWKPQRSRWTAMLHAPVALLAVADSDGSARGTNTTR